MKFRIQLLILICCILIITVLTININYIYSQSPIIGKVEQIDVQRKEIIIKSPGVLKMGEKLSVNINNKVIILNVIFPMQTIAKCKLIQAQNSYFNQITKGMPVYRYVDVVENKIISDELAKDFTIGGMEFVFIQGGQFIMGSGNGIGQVDEHPEHKVNVSSFWMGKYEVTQKQYKMVMGKNPSHFLGDDNPVETVSWKDAVQFCMAFSKKYNIQARLPYEAEWEYACRAGSKTIFYWGDIINRDYCWYKTEKYVYSDMKTHPVGKKKPNPWGLYDMSGNVREWCMDWYKSNYYSMSPVNNPRGPASGEYKILRGGDWGNTEEQVRSAIRHYSLPDDLWSNTVGFRIVVIR